MRVGRKLWMVGAWVAATAASAGVALAVVGVAGDQVADEVVRPLSPQQVESLGLPAAGTAPTSPGSDVAGSEPTVPGSTAVEPTVPVHGTVSGPTSTSLPGAETGSTTTAIVPPTTVSSEGPRIDSRRITGGTVVVRWTTGGVELVSATPDDGFDVDVEDRGPEKVDVEFEGPEVDSRYTAVVSDGDLIVDVVVDGGDHEGEEEEGED